MVFPESTTELLYALKKVLLKSFFVGLFITIALALIIFSGWNLWMSWAMSMLHTNEAVLTQTIIDFFMTVRFYLLYILLTPALGICWALKCSGSSSKTN